MKTHSYRHNSDSMQLHPVRGLIRELINVMMTTQGSLCNVTPVQNHPMQRKKERSGKKPSLNGAQRRDIHKRSDWTNAFWRVYKHAVITLFNKMMNFKSMGCLAVDTNNHFTSGNGPIQRQPRPMKRFRLQIISRLCQRLIAEMCGRLRGQTLLYV